LPRTLGHPGLGEVRVAASPSGGAVAAWDDADVLWSSTWRPADGWSAPETPPAGTCVRPQIAEAVAMGAGGEALLVASAGLTDDWHHGLVRAWARRSDGTWLGPAWLSRAAAGSTVAAIDGSGRMHVAWNRESDVPSRVEVTSTDIAEAGIDAVPGEPVATVSRVRVLARGRGAVTVRFRLSRPARVAVELTPAAGGRSVSQVRSRGRRGPNAVVLRLDRRRPVRPGWYVGSVWHERSFLWGCAVVSPRVRIR
jgi:hypothetical protein